jgi:hypothetical protein
MGKQKGCQAGVDAAIPLFLVKLRIPTNVPPLIGRNVSLDKIAHPFYHSFIQVDSPKGWSTLRLNEASLLRFTGFARFSAYAQHWLISRICATPGGTYVAISGPLSPFPPYMGVPQPS